MRWVFAVVLMVVLLVGCGKPEVEEDSYEDYLADYYQTKLALHILQNRYGELEVDYERVKVREAEYAGAVKILQNENQALRVEVALVKSLGGSQQGELESVLNELNALKFGRLTFIRETEQKYEAILAKYNAIEALYPPVHFTDKAELVKWRASSGNVTGCLELQRGALAGGYIVSLHPSFDYCTAVVGDYLYKITPGDKELVEKIGKVE